MKRYLRGICLVTVGILVGGLSFWATLPKERGVDVLAQDALCVLELPAGNQNASTSFTTSKAVERFYVGAQTRASREQVWLSISSNEGSLGFTGPVTQATSFTLGQGVPPGTYKVTLRQDVGDHGGLAVISGKEPPVSITGWQIWSRTFLGLFVLSGIWALTERKSKNLKRKAMSLYTFQMLLLAFLIIFFYLLFHEGGHALAQACFHRFDLAQSDFWGISGHPHSGSKAGPALEPWQQAVITGSGPTTPILVGWALFLFWRSRSGKKYRLKHSLVNLYLSTIIALFVFTSVVLAGGLLGILSENQTEFAISCIHGPPWIVHAILWTILLLHAFILWRVVPEIWKVWKTRVLDLRNQNKRFQT